MVTGTVGIANGRSRDGIRRPMCVPAELPFLKSLTLVLSR